MHQLIPCFGEHSQKFAALVSEFIILTWRPCLGFNPFIFKKSGIL
jgi:hypothetical protein